MGHLVEATPGGWRVRLDDGRELVAQVGHAAGLYRLEPGEEVCVSLAPGREPMLTGYLTSPAPALPPA
jgi:hypothetical protein